MKFNLQIPSKGAAAPSHEVVIAPLSRLSNSLKNLGLEASRISPETESLWTKKQKKLLGEQSQNSAEASKPSRSDESKVQTALLHDTAGCSLRLLFISQNLSTFELHQTLRRQLESMFREQAAREAEFPLRVSLSLLSSDQQESILLALGALAEMACWEPEKFGKSGDRQKKERKRNGAPVSLSFVCSLPTEKARRILNDGQLLGQANNTVRTLADLPANELTPASYQARARDFSRSHGLSYEFWNLAELKRRKAGAFLAVNRADPASKAGIAVLKYRPKKAGKKTPVLALVGKGLCFDTGGYNIKTGSYMYGMHGDMTGSALAIALCGYFAQAEAPFEVHAYLALAENLISPTAYKPNEVVVACDGTSIEVIDTDAEGRMVLSDTLALVRRTRPDLCIDFATLTGAAIRSLDTRRGAVFSNREALARLAVETGEESGERTWSFPIGEDYREGLKSKVADLQQCGSGNNADHIYAATFLSHFIGDETPWVHMDLAPAENKGGLGLAGTDTTGFGVFWTRQFAQQALKGARK